ncbi:hypothetical protein DXG03_002984 [Asterophora parasitica]|uniref:Uncharacterized protein n=1 Tax=Asterophora parasitica TaxID=117018 RepID=A0A9P7G3F9_9AGAR|nr:hypothetical protein DXG03_002984 [Asterophora parasitica]
MGDAGPTLVSPPPSMMLATHPTPHSMANAGLLSPPSSAVAISPMPTPGGNPPNMLGLHPPPFMLPPGPAPTAPTPTFPIAPLINGAIVFATPPRPISDADIDPSLRTPSVGSTETGSWLFIAGQHTNATSSNSFLHYTSPSLTCDAYEDSNKLVNIFGQAVGGIITFNKQQVQKLNQDYEDAKRQREDALEDVRHAREALAEQVDRSVILETLIQQVMNGTLSPSDLKIPNAASK